MSAALFVSPTVPDRRRSGVASRAFHELEALAERHRVHLLLTGQHGGHQPLPAEAAALCASVVEVPIARVGDPWLELKLRLHHAAPWLASALFRRPAEWRYVTPVRLRRAAEAFAGVSFDLVHVFRLYALPFAEAWLRRSGRVQLDLDEVESTTRLSLARLAEVAGDRRRAARWRAEAAKYALLEEAELRRFDVLFVCSALEAARLPPHARGRAHVLPNVVAVPERAEPRLGSGEPPRLLFVGMLGYAPNEDAVRWLCAEILPRLEACGRPHALTVVGREASSDLARVVARCPGAVLRGPVADLGPLYAAADTAVAPIRAGGGTRIKVLEALAHARPVVCTSFAAEGLELRDGAELLCADDPAAFAEACVRLAGNAELRRRLALAGRAAVRARYHARAVREVLDAAERTRRSCA